MASPIALEIADMKRKTDITSERIFLGALVKAYSSPVMEARISEIALFRVRSEKTDRDQVNISNNSAVNNEIK